MELFLTELKIVDDSALLIEWNDGLRRRYEFSQLRNACPCAACRHSKSEEPADPMKLPLLSPSEIEPIKITQMVPTGNYAYRITFSDGHNTGLFTFELLRELGKTVE
ncbi:DUF971 domain-containing protein [Gimesia aquarii]|uniref:Gamma-butyrobetaine hydroxylase-like N-terminal domain-containing protein n=1 Tax=Gimesia aquarii TaxID=2527964 RepID=A0A517X1K3_9PLAN|nr:DUF971 domain-containing protein [Gimesia aquarii]QDU11383.1 hypothetical protein V202x_48040 [Gimesia aquarii]